MKPVLIPPRLRRRQRGFFTIDQYRSGAGGGGSTDPYFSDVVQLAHFDGADGSTTLTNSCPRGNTMVVTGSNVISTARSVFGGASLRKPSGSAAVWGCSSSSHADYQFGTGDFTIEFRYYVDTIGTHNVLDMSNGVFGSAVAIYTLATGALIVYVNTADRITSATGVIGSAAWYAICVCRVSGSTRLFVNGSQVGSTWADSTNYNATAYSILGSTAGANPLLANWDELRITNGTGRYSANYTPATEAFPDS